MKKFISFLTSLSLLLSSQAFALTYVETRPEAISSLGRNGLGAVYAFLRPDGAIERDRVVGLVPSTDGKSVTVTLERADTKLIVNFADENHFSYEPVASEADAAVPTSKNASPTPTSQTGPGIAMTGPDWTVGLSAGVLSGLQAGIIEASGLSAQIEAAYRRIEELHQKIGEDFRRVERARFDLESKVVAVSLLATQAKPQATLLEIDLATPNRIRTRELVDQTKSEAAQIKFLSKDARFLSQAQAIQRTLVSAQVKDSIDQSFFDISKTALVVADQQSFLGRNEAADISLEIAKTAADVLVGLDPFTGAARSLYESISGTNLITGESLTPVERAISVAGVLTAGYALKSYAGFKVLQKISLKVAPAAKRGIEFAEHLFFSTRRPLNPRAAEKIERSINTLSGVNKKWGFTQRHLNKHFLGDSAYSLKVIDPGGNAEVWLSHIADLFQRPVTRVLDDGAVDVMGRFPRTNGKGSYDLGVRLWPNKDGTFELITVLTRQ